MRQFELTLELKSPCLIGSAEGFGTLIDSDIVFDELGIPYVPAKRIKGCLRDSAIQICQFFELADIMAFDLSKDNTENRYKLVTEIFGCPGSDKPASFYFSNLHIVGYDNIKSWLHFYREHYRDLVCPEVIINHFTEIRQQTAIDENGVAKKHSLRTIRVAVKGLIFRGSIDTEIDDEERVMLLSLAVANLRRIGTKRNRGFGRVECRLYEGSKEVNFFSHLEEKCRQ